MIVYHRTDSVEAIQQDGFRDGTGSYLTLNTYSGVWVSNVPLTINEGASGKYVLSIEVPVEVLAPYEWD